MNGWLNPHLLRTLPGEGTIRITLRTAHLAAMGVLVGGHVYGVDAEWLLPARAATVATGAAFVALELYGSFAWLGQARGVLTLVKIARVGAVPWLWEQRVWLLLAALVLGSAVSHLPSSFRYYSLRRRAVADGPHAKE